MDGSPQLLSNIQFSEAKKGYDRDQVDNFLRELSKKVGELQDMLRQATQRAEAAEAKAIEAVKAKAAADAAVEQAKAEVAQALAAAQAAPPPAPEPVNEIEAASGVLALAQKTAQAAVDEAEHEAADTLADARAKAAMMVVEAEQEIERIKTRASQQVDTLMEKKTAEAEAEVARLQADRDLLQLDVDQLRSYLDEHRTKLRQSIDQLAVLADERGPLDPGAPPELAGSPTPAGAASRAPAADPAPAAPEPVAEEPAAPAPADPAPVDTAPDAPAPGATVVPDDTSAGRAEPPDAPPLRVADAAEPVTIEPVTIEPAPELAPEPATIEPTPVTVQPTPTPAPVEADGEVPERRDLGIVTLEDLSAPATTVAPAPASPIIDLTGEHETVPADRPTQLFDVLGAAPEADDLGAVRPLLIDADPVVPTDVTVGAPVLDTSLGSPDADADEAMRAFFEQDPDGEAGAQKSGRFLRRK